LKYVLFFISLIFIFYSKYQSIPFHLSPHYEVWFKEKHLFFLFLWFPLLFSCISLLYSKKAKREQKNITQHHPFYKELSLIYAYRGWLYLLLFLCILIGSLYIIILFIYTSPLTLESLWSSSHLYIIILVSFTPTL